MIKLATVFSGIGAIEHALDRMSLEHKIVFACDNGDIVILSKTVNSNLDEISEELNYLDALITEIDFSEEEREDEYNKQITDMLAATQSEYNDTICRINKIDITEALPSLTKVLQKITTDEDVKAQRKKEYKNFMKELESDSSDSQKKLLVDQIILEVTNDYKKDNSLLDLGKAVTNKSTDNIKWEAVSADLKCLYEHLEMHTGKRIIRKVQDIAQRTGQLHEKINSLRHLRKLRSLGDNYAAKKEYVDNLYAGQEKRNKVKQSYMANYDCDEHDFHWDVTFLDGRQYRGKVDLFVGGSPCQSFSLVGKQRGLEDTRGTLFYEYARLINEIQPKVFIYENVRAILSNDGGKTWEKMKEVFQSLGYHVYYTKNGKPSVLNAKDYGVPQNRERMFVVGFRNDIELKKEFEFPAPIPLEKKMQDLLLDNAPGGYFLPEKGVDFVTMQKNLAKRYTQIDGDIALCQKKNQQFNWHGDFVFQSETDAENNHIDDLEKYFLSEKVRKYVLSSGTKNFYSKPKTDLEIARPLLTTMHKMHRAGVDNYVTTDGRLRKLTPRECLRLMGFSDSWKIVVADTSMYQQAGNSIVVDVLIAIMHSIFDALGIDVGEANNND